MKNIVLIIAYDGTHYLGWQETSTGPSIEQTLREILQQILQEPIALQAASRTDAGVHALGQVVNFTTVHPHLNLSQLHKSLNSLLPKDISVLSISEADPSFHPTLNCKGKEYHYYLCNSFAQVPQHRLYSWHYFYPLNLELMQSAARLMIGERDFSAFCNVKKNASYKHQTRALTKLEIIPLQGERYRFEIAGNHFLYKMVRNLVGTLVYIGRGKLSWDSLESIFSSKDRTKAGITAPAHGLHLDRVFY